MPTKDIYLFDESASGIEVFKKWLKKLEELSTKHSSMADGYAGGMSQRSILKYGKDKQILLKISTKLNDVALLVDELGTRLFTKYYK